MREHYDYLIVGSGLFGATFAHFAMKAGKTCLVLEKRPHTGGNVHCENIEGINVHSYGAHIFHTSNRKLWEFVNSVVPFNGFVNSPLANWHGEIYNLPFNMNTFRQMWGVETPQEAKAIIEEQRKEVSGEPRNLEEQAISLVGRDIYLKLVKEYTEKQWGRDCKDLPAFIIRRLPVRFEFNNNYFNDSYQGIPVGGYNRLVDGLLRGADILTGVDYLLERERWDAMADKVVYSGRIDEFFGCRYGELEFRTLRFQTEVLDTPDYQHNAVVNYTSHEQDFTRIIEHKHFEMFGDAVQACPKTVISREYPSEWKAGMEPFYPVNNERNQELYLRYKALADAQDRVIFGGRLAEYRYYDMAPVMEKAMSYFDE